MSVLPKLPAGTQEQTWRDGILRKGFVRRGYIAEVPGLYPEMRFVYEPIMAEIVDGYEHRIAMAKTPEQSVVLICQKLAERVKVWSYEPEISEKEMRCLQPAQLNRLRLIVFGRGASDVDPLWEDGDSSDAYESIEEQLGKS